jgi:rhamnosyltransferase
MLLSCDNDRVDVSIVIRAKDEGESLPKVLDAVEGQAPGDREVLLVDSGSTDDTLAVGRDRGCRVVELAPGEFSYGRALNRGLAAARGEIVVFLSAHAEPVSSDWLGELTAPLSDPRVGAVFGRQVPRSDATPFDRWSLLACYGEEPLRFAKDPPFSNANAAVRRDLALRLPFDENVPYAEDRIWARSVCEEGHLVAYAPGAAVLHSHRETFSQVLSRERRETAVRVGVLGDRAPLARPWMIPPALTLAFVRDTLRILGERSDPRWILRSPAYRLARLLGAYLGGRDARRERS